jgi:hypothetical protein
VGEDHREGTDGAQRIEHREDGGSAARLVASVVPELDGVPVVARVVAGVVAHVRGAPGTRSPTSMESTQTVIEGSMPTSRTESKPASTRA